MKFLIVEDNEKMRAYIRRILERSSIAVAAIYECDNYEDAVTLYHQHQPDWVLMDIQLKNTDGLTATKLIRNSDPAAKVIIVTQYDDPGYRKMAKDAGVVGYVLKDDLQELVGVIMSYDFC